MNNRFQSTSRSTGQLTGLALLISGVVLSGCATKQEWSPELDKAREAYQTAASDPAVKSHAAAELERAEKQLKLAEDASDFFKSREEIDHEAALAHLKIQEAQQVARAQTAKGNIKLAQAGQLPAQQRLSLQESPVLAAATPASSGTVTGGSHAKASETETQIIAQQLADLSHQINLLQQQISAGSLHTSAQPAIAEPTTTDPTTTQATVVQPTLADNPDAVVSLVEHSVIESEIAVEPQINDEPVLGAARPAPETPSAAPAAFQAPNVASDARLRQELRSMNARPTERGMSLTLGERYFESGSARLWTGRAARHLDNVAAALVETPGLTLEVEAHTDNAGTEDEKNNLTFDRAIAIKSALVLRGVSAARINATGYGDTAPIADNDTQLGRLQNRRVEIIFPNIDDF